MNQIKKFFKNHWLIMIVIVFLIGLVLIYQKYYSQFAIRDEFENRFCHFILEGGSENETDSFCNDILEEKKFKNDLYSTLMCQKFARDGVYEGTEKTCQEIVATENEPKDDFFLMLTNMVIDLTDILNPFSFLFIVIPTLIGICKILRRKYIINSTTRQSYKTFLVQFFKKAYRYVWVLPVFALFMIVVCILSTTFDHTFSLTHPNNILWELTTIQNKYLFILGYVGNILMYSFFFINLSLIVARKHHNTFVAIIVSYLTYIGIELFFEIIVKTFMYIVLHSELGEVFNIMNLWTYSDAWGLFPLLTFSATICILSFIGVYFAYRDKESFVIACEKNN